MLCAISLGKTQAQATGTITPRSVLELPMTDYEVHLRRYGGAMHGPMIIRLEAEDPVQAQRAARDLCPGAVVTRVEPTFSIH